MDCFDMRRQEAYNVLENDIQKKQSSLIGLKVVDCGKDMMISFINI